MWLFYFNLKYRGLPKSVKKSYKTRSFKFSGLSWLFKKFQINQKQNRLLKNVTLTFI